MLGLVQRVGLRLLSRSVATDRVLEATAEVAPSGRDWKGRAKSSEANAAGAARRVSPAKTAAVEAASSPGRSAIDVD